MYFCVSFCLAIIASVFQTALLPASIVYGVGVAAIVFLIIAYFSPACRCICVCLAGALLGLAYVNAIADWRLGHRLPEKYEQVDVDIDVRISSLPVMKDRFQQYQADVLKVNAPNADNISITSVLLSDYAPKMIHPCDTFRMVVRLKRPHTLGNPAGFDYEAYLLEQGIDARGYVREAALLNENKGFCIYKIRQSWSDFVLSKVSAENAAWIVALSTGDKSLLSDQQNDLLQATGTMHLFIISGSHIALCALAVYSALMLIRRLGGGRFFPGDWRPYVSLAALLVAAFYTALAGFGIPSIRSLLMLMVFMGSQVIGLQLGLWMRFVLSLFMVLLLDPLSSLNVGFVLSFGAVFVLILIAEEGKEKPLKLSRIQSILKIIQDVFWVQVLIFIGLLPVTLWYFHQVSLLSPLVNFIAVPAMSVIILPTIFAALFFWCLNSTDAGLLSISQYQLEVLIRVMQSIHDSIAQYANIYPVVSINRGMYIALVMAVLLLLLPKAFKMRCWGLLLLGMVFSVSVGQSMDDTILKMDVLDVDQGLAVLVRTRQHHLLVDTGASWPGGSMAQRAVNPYLLSLGIRRLDAVLVSHLDNDHVGGLHDVLQSFEVGKVISSEALPASPFHVCKAGEQWQWDGVTFRFLHPDYPGDFDKRNNRSCVLLIEAAGRRLLLPGDAEAEVEDRFAASVPALDVLVAGHHGSKTSSTMAVAKQVKNGVVIFSSGYLSRFGHPHPGVEQRFHQLNTKSWVTALAGMVSISIDLTGAMSVVGWRESQGKYWQHITRRDNHVR